MLDLEEFHMMRDLKKEGLNVSQIAEKMGCDRKTVRKYLSAQALPAAQTRKTKPTKLDKFQEYIQQRITEYPLSAARIYREIRERGYEGQYTTVKNYIRTIRPPQSTLAVLRYETPPGVQIQVDWADCYWIEVDGQVRKVYCFSMVLGFSRMRYMEFTLSTDVYTLIKCHLNAFEYFGGYTEEMLYDNIKQVIIKRAIRPKENVWNLKFEDFFTYYGFIPRLCKPYCPHTKGKIENSIGYMKRDFLLGGTFSSFDDMNRQLRKWIDRVNGEVHGTTNEIPFERLKLENLKSITVRPLYQVRREESRKVSRDSYVSYQGNRYSVPYQYAGRSVTLEIQADKITIRQGPDVLCSHELIPGHSRMVRQKEHFKGLLSLAMKCNSQSRKLSKPPFRIIGPEVEHRPLSIYDSFSEKV
jgi:transposase